MHKLLEVGSVGCLLKRSARDDLPQAIHAVPAGGIYVDHATAGQAIESSVKRPNDDAGALCRSLHPGQARFVWQPSEWCLRTAAMQAPSLKGAPKQIGVGTIEIVN